MILIAIWWLQKSGKYLQYVNKQYSNLKCNLRKQNELEVLKQYQIKISDRFVGLENLSVSEDINKAFENIKENIKTSAKESLSLFQLKQHKSWFDGECLRV